MSLFVSAAIDEEGSKQADARKTDAEAAVPSGQNWSNAGQTSRKEFSNSKTSVELPDAQADAEGSDARKETGKCDFARFAWHIGVKRSSCITCVGQYFGAMDGQRHLGFVSELSLYLAIAFAADDRKEVLHSASSKNTGSRRIGRRLR